MAVHKTALLAGIVVVSLLSFTTEAKFARFAAIPPSFSKDQVVPAAEFVAPITPKAWYASWPTSMRMTIIGGDPIRRFMLNCFTEPLDGADQLSEMNFCFNDKCTQLTSPGTRSLTLKGPTGLAFQVTLSFSERNGGNVDYGSLVDHDKDMSTSFYCSVKNAMGTVQSNTLKIMDFRYRYPKEVKVVSNQPPSDLPTNAPLRLKCFEGSTAPGPDDPPYIVDWSYCRTAGIIKPSACTTVLIQNIVDSLGNTWPVHVRSNGDLYVPFFPDGAVKALSGRMLVCSLYKNRKTYYQNPLKFSTKPPDSNVEIKSLTMVRPTKKEKVRIFNSPTTDIKFPCNFQMGPGSYSLTWKFTPKDGGSPMSISSPTRNKQGVSFFKPSNSIQFRGPFSDATVGTYTCEVTWTPVSGPNQVVTGSYEVEVQFFPTVSKKMVPLKYVVDGDNGVVQCLFEGLLVKPSLEINGENIDLKNKQSVEDSIKTVNNAYKKVMSALSVKVSPENPAPGKVITYTAEKMQYRSEMSNLPSTHTVQCIGKNEVGSVRANVLLKVVPKPVMVVGKSPSSLNCSECSAAEPHTIRCDVSNELAINQSGVLFGQYWLLGNQRVDDLLGLPNAPARKYLDVSENGKSLTIRKIDDEDFKKKVNELGKVECVLTLGYPASTTKLPPEVKQTGVERGLFFISSHTDMRKELTTVIKLTNIAPPTLKTGSMMWVIPVILALIVILIIIGATYYCCRQRKSGEEYNVDAKEKQQGNDPEVEVAEKEAFPVFERPEDGPIRGSRASLDDSIHVGSDDEDEVLAEYDVDIGKFDEEGSFIGQYAVNDGAATGNRRLPQVGNNTEV